MTLKQAIKVFQNKEISKEKFIKIILQFDKEFEKLEEQYLAQVSLNESSRQTFMALIGQLSPDVRQVMDEVAAVSLEVVKGKVGKG